MKASNREKEIYKVTTIGAVGNLLLLIFKFIAGFLSNSAAMIADAVHSFSDFLTDIVVMIFVRISSKEEDENHHYGHGKFETLATVIIGIVLVAVGLGIMKNGIVSIVEVAKGNSIKSPGIIALVAAIVSIIVKEILYRYTVIKGKKLDSPSVVANAWHHRSDAFSSIGTALGIGGAIILGNKWTILDPIAAVIVSFFILKVAYQLTKAGLDELLEKSLPKEIEKKIIEILLSFNEISSPHHLRTRRIGKSYSIDVHIRMDGAMSLYDAHQITVDIENKLKEELHKDIFINIHMEPIK
ncbi:MAG: cation transporter [Bacteroidales bacterium]|nr:cation transporter [Bacteroidales bacterium]